MDLKPIPAFYCCYLLRSTVRHASLYVGSTPNPARRLSQHNGTTKGGASRTARNNLRPWEMACIVTGFPSNIAALQFEWAWQNAHLTRRINNDERVSLAKTRTKVNATTGQVRRRKVRPGMSLADRLANLHLLLRAPSFVRWPLELRFFTEDVYKAWKKRCIELNDDLTGDINVVLDLPSTASSASGGGKAATGFDSIDPTYAPLKEHVDKSSFLLADGERVSCAVCKDRVNSRQTVLVCSNSDCSAASHMSCLGSHFLAGEKSDSIVPKTGKCPKCLSVLSWVDLVREMSLRTRAEKDLPKLLKKKRSRKKAAADIQSTELALNESEEEEDDENEFIRAEDVVDEPLRHEADDDDAMSIASEPGVLSQRSARMLGGLDEVVEDTETESIEILG